MNRHQARGSIRIVQGGLILAALLPAGWLLWWALQGQLGRDPAETVAEFSGSWALCWLILTLCITPLRRLSGWRWPIRLRRILGLSAFGYACLHLLSYLALESEFSIGNIAVDLTDRPYILLGFAAFVCLVPLAVTSTDAMMKRLGRHWGLIHRLIYPAALLVVFHYLWLAQQDLLQALVYSLIVLLLLGYRLGRLLIRMFVEAQGEGQGRPS